MRDYSKGKIYKLVSNQTDEVYYGSTCSPLSKRLYKHKAHYKAWLNKKHCYLTSYEIIKYEDAQIILVKEYPCENKYQLERKERKYIEKYDCVNHCIPTQTQKEWREKNKEYLNIGKKIFYEENKERILQTQKVRYENNKENIQDKRKIKYQCVCGSIIRKADLSRHKKSTKHQKNIQ